LCTLVHTNEKAELMKREYDLSKGRRGPVVPPEPGKTRITIRLDNNVLDHFRKQVHEMGGGNYQSLINDALREYIQRGGIEAAVRRAVRQELKELGFNKRTASG
jgi:uncharacterized protein (DUF4415 family)